MTDGHTALPAGQAAPRDPDVWGPYSLLRKPSPADFHSGRRCRIRGARHPAFYHLAGKYVRIHQASHGTGLAWVYDDRPVTLRINRRGNQERSDPRCILSSMSFDELDPL